MPPCLLVFASYPRKEREVELSITGMRKWMWNQLTTELCAKKRSESQSFWQLDPSLAKKVKFMQSSTICQLALKKGRGEPWNLMQGMLQLPTEDPDLEGKAVKLNFQRKEVLPLPKDSKWSKDKLNFSRVNQIICWKHWRAARSQTGFFSVSHSSLSSLHPQVDFVVVSRGCPFIT